MLSTEVVDEKRGLRVQFGYPLLGIHVSWPSTEQEHECIVPLPLPELSNTPYEASSSPNCAMFSVTCWCGALWVDG